MSDIGQSQMQSTSQTRFHVNRIHIPILCCIARTDPVRAVQLEYVQVKGRLHSTATLPTQMLHNTCRHMQLR